MHNAAQSTMRVLVLVSKHVHDHPHSPPLHRAWHRRPPAPRQQHAPRAACATASSAAVPVPTGRVFYRAVGFFKKRSLNGSNPKLARFFDEKTPHALGTTRTHTQTGVHTRVKVSTSIVSHSTIAPCRLRRRERRHGRGSSEPIDANAVASARRRSRRSTVFLFFTRPKKSTHTSRTQSWCTNHDRVRFRGRGRSTRTQTE